MESIGPAHPFTALVPNLAGVNPDDAFSGVPYQKGSTFLWFLEKTVGGPALFEPFLKSYFSKFAYQSIDSDDFKTFFLDYFSGIASVESIDWDTWLHQPGMPVYKPDFDEGLTKTLMVDPTYYFESCFCCNHRFVAYCPPEPGPGELAPC